MTQYATRREQREAERRGIYVQPVTEVAPSQASNGAPVDLKNLTRRQLKELGLFDNPEKLLAATVAEIEPPAPGVELASQVTLLPKPEIEIPKTYFNEQNFMAEPTTASIVLERAPEAIVLPIETGEIAVTSSIQVVTNPITSPTTGNFDGRELDRIILSDDAVTGVISVVEPISALDLIDQRATSGVVPASVLSKGWWRPWAIGIGAVLMTVAAAVAIFFMLNAVGSNL